MLVLHVRHAWNLRGAGGGHDSKFDEQVVKWMCRLLQLLAAVRSGQVYKQRAFDSIHCPISDNVSSKAVTVIAEVCEADRSASTASFGSGHGNGLLYLTRS